MWIETRLVPLNSMFPTFKMLVFSVNLSFQINVFPGVRHRHTYFCINIF